MSAAAIASCTLLERRCAAVPDALHRALDAAPPRSPPDALARGRWVTTGIGASEGPARLLAALLRQRVGRCATFVPLSSFADPQEPDARGDVLAIFSQGISPNARLALAQRRSFGAAVLITSARPEHDAALAALVDDGVAVYAHEPADEAGLLLRVLGPPVAALAACRLANAVAERCGAPAAVPAALLAGIPDAVRAARAPAGVALDDRVALVTAGALGAALAFGLRWKWLEGLGAEPSHWDVLQIAHGPLQAFYDVPITLFALASDASPAGDALFARLGALLRAPRHQLVHLRAQLPGAAAFFEHDALCNQLLVRALAARPRDLAAWPGQGQDGPLYDLGGR